MGILTKVRSFMLGTDIDDDDYAYDDAYAEDYAEEEEAYYEPPKAPVRELYTPSRKKAAAADAKVLNLPTAAAVSETRARIVKCHPQKVDDAASICDHLRTGIICVVNLEGVERITSQRIADFLCGACYALGGEIDRLSNEIFLIAPKYTEISSELRDELKTSGLILPWIASAFK